MPVYNYLSRDRSGRISRNKIQAYSTIDLRSKLNAMDVQLVSFNAPSFSGAELVQLLNLSQWLPTRSRDVELALHQLAIMLRSGLKLLDALKAVQLQTERRSLAKVLEKVYDSVSRGDSLSKSLSTHGVFPKIIVQLVSVGESAGALDQALEQGREHLADRRAILTEVRVAMAYPAVVTTAALSIAAYLILFVIPQLQTFLNALGRDLPAMTQSLVDLAQWLRMNGPTLIGCLSLLATCLVVTLYTSPGRLLLDQCLLRLPIIGRVLRLSGTASLASCLAVMMRSGIRLVEALHISVHMQRNTYLAKLLRLAGHRVTRGQPLAPSLAAHHGFSPILSSMIEVAERAGNMDRTLEEVSKLCDTELKARIKSMSRMVEPMVILLAGGIVGYVYIAFFLALMSAGSTVR